MIWIFITFVVLAVSYAKLGAMSVWLHMLSTAFNFLFVLMIGLTAMYFWRKRNQQKLIR